LPVDYGEERDLFSSSSQKKVQTEIPENPVGKLLKSLISRVYWILFFGPWTWMFRAASWLVPKQANLFIFGSNEGKHFSDNSRSLFEYIQSNDDSIRAVWFTNNKEVYKKIDEEYPGSVVMSPSFKSAYIYLRAKEAIISYGYQDLCKMPWIPSIKVNQFWHGVPIKKIGLLRNSTKTKSDYGPTWPIFIKWIDKVDRFFVASDYERRVYIQAFSLPEDRFVLSGNPRNDLLYETSAKKESPGNVILYAPTFRSRHHDGQNDNGVLIHPNIDETTMHNFLVRNNARLIVRPHWIDGKRTFNSDRIECVTHDEEPNLNRIFVNSDILITDYSSAFIDWLILDRPLIFVPYDLESYEEKNGFLDDYEALVPQPIRLDAEEALIEIEKAIVDRNRYRNDRSKAMIRYLQDGKYGICERVMYVLKNNRDE